MGILRQLARRGIEAIPALEAVIRTAHGEWEWLSRRTVRTPHGFLFAGNSTMQNGSFEPKECALVLSLLPKFDVLVDVGANVGFYTCLAISHGKEAIAIEPLAANVRALCTNLAANGWSAEIWPVGLAERPRIAFLHGGSTGASLVPGWSGTTGAWKRPIPLNTLDNLLGTRFNGKRLLIKVDVEGSEIDVLGGAVSTLRQEAIWIMEIVLDMHRREPNPHFLETFEIFWNSGYECSSISEERFVSREEVQQWAASGHLPPHFTDWLFTPATSR